MPRAVGVDAGATKRPQHPVLQGAAGDAVAVGAHEQRSRRRPGGQSPAGGGAPFDRGRKASRSAVEIALEQLDQCRLVAKVHLQTSASKRSWSLLHFCVVWITL